MKVSGNMAESIIEDKLHLFVFNLEAHYCDPNRGVDIVIGADYGTVRCLLSQVSSKMSSLAIDSKKNSIGLGFKLENLSFTFTFFNRID